MSNICYISYINSSLMGTAVAVKSDYAEKRAEKESLRNPNSYTAGEENPKKEKVAKSQQEVSGVKIYFPRVNDSTVF